MYNMVFTKKDGLFILALVIAFILMVVIGTRLQRNYSDQFSSVSKEHRVQGAITYLTKNRDAVYFAIDNSNKKYKVYGLHNYNYSTEQESFFRTVKLWDRIEKRSGSDTLYLRSDNEVLYYLISE